MQKGAQEKTQDGPRRLEEVAQEGSKRPSEGPKEPQEAPTVQMRLNPSTLPSARGPRRRDLSPISSDWVLVITGTPPPHSLTQPPPARTHIHSYSDSLKLRLTHTQTYSHSISLTLRPTHTPTTQTHTHSDSDSLTVMLTDTQTYSHSDSLTLTCTHRAHSNSYSGSPFGGCLRRCACVCPFPRTSLLSEQVARV